MLRRVFDAAVSDRISLVAAGCAFYAMLALFPALSLCLSLAGLVLDPGSVEPQLDLVRHLLPEDSFELIAARIAELAAAPRPRLQGAALISAGIALWSASAGIRAMLGALNLARGTVEERGMLRFYATALLLTLGAIVAVVLGLVALVLLPLVLGAVGLRPLELVLVRAAGLAMMCLMVVGAIGLLYRFGPARPPAGWRLLSPGALAATALWLLASALFSIYAGHSDAYGTAYGSLGAAVALLMWLYISTYVILLGAELDAALAAPPAPPPQ